MGNDFLYLLRRRFIIHKRLMVLMGLCIIRNIIITSILRELPNKINKYSYTCWLYSDIYPRPKFNFILYISSNIVSSFSFLSPTAELKVSYSYNVYLIQLFSATRRMYSRCNQDIIFFKPLLFCPKILGK